MRGDANGRIALWKIPDTPECASMQLKKVSADSHNFISFMALQFYFWKFKIF